MKIIAMYLPQFHEVKENSEWWGDGFTEWTAVRQAASMYEGHDQPRIPLNNNYYNLLKKETMVWQEQLIHLYGIYGLCFYHYWFKDGKKILEKPAENLLKWKDINIPFCFSWANESWVRTWSNLDNMNVWTNKFESASSCTEDNNGILLEQKYGTENQWKDHFEYLLPFFKDERYIKIDGQPVFIFYRPDSIPCLVRMMDYWTRLALEAGLNGIYYIGTNTNQDMNARLIMPPGGIQCRRKNCDKTLGNIKTQINYDDLWSGILNQQFDNKKKVFFAGFTGFDNTPRMGTAGTIIIGSSPELFSEYLKRLLAKSETRKNEFVFLNAWNEWGEGMYLEPDESNGYAYLEAVRTALRDYKAEQYKNTEDTRINPSLLQTNMLDHYRSNWSVLNKWFTLKEDNIKLETCFLDLNIHSIAIYGMGTLGFHLVKELKDSNIKILYGIDQMGDVFNTDFPIYCLEDKFPDVDAIIVTVTYLFYSIYQALKQKTNCLIMSLDEIVTES